ncbi:hypothetical protein [Pontibacter sp. G13]|uniref:hypothetical protein n=1 Tax=Pontibacter sp. G13 TaxID=3074898 RepID=UPI002889EADA|nr:hypothetical protein [Pontibacter sp. G13]WNJ16204.1 hypothetical protein RJD25_15175 [Pontibacter sp. G13]
MTESKADRHVEHGSLWDYQGGPYDTLLLMMNGIGLVGDFQGLNRFFEKARTLLAEGGQILMDSSDVSYLYDEDSGVEKPQGRYYGIIGYQMSFGTVVGDPFEWLYIDYPRLIKQCEFFGMKCELISEGGHYEYLARITMGD